MYTSDDLLDEPQLTNIARLPTTNTHRSHPDLIKMNSPVDFSVARARPGLEPSSFEGLITFICVSGISRKSKLLQRLIGIWRGLRSCPADEKEDDWNRNKVRGFRGERFPRGLAEVPNRRN
jgi:hypothetical protein